MQKMTCVGQLCWVSKYISLTCFAECAGKAALKLMSRSGWWRQNDFLFSCPLPNQCFLSLCGVWLIRRLFSESFHEPNHMKCNTKQQHNALRGSYYQPSSPLKGMGVSVCRHTAAASGQKNERNHTYHSQMDKKSFYKPAGPTGCQRSGRIERSVEKKDHFWTSQRSDSCQCV